MFYSFLARGTLITLADETTKAIEELVEEDKVLTYNYSTKNNEAAHLENNELRIGTIANLIKYLIPRKDTVKVTLSNGNEIVVTKDFPLIGAGKAIGWQVYDAIAYKDKEVSFEVLEVGKELYSWPIKVSEYEHITSLEEQTGEDLEEMYCINKVMIGHTIFANGILVAACDWGYVWPDEFYINEGNYYQRGEDTMSDIFKVKVDDITMTPSNEKLIKSNEDKSYSNHLPITVIRCSAKSKKWIVVDGHHRVLEARNNNITELDAMMHIPAE